MDSEDVWFYFLMCYFHEHYSELISVIFIISFIGIIWGIIHEMRWLSVFFYATTVNFCGWPHFF